MKVKRYKANLLKILRLINEGNNAVQLEEKTKYEFRVIESAVRRLEENDYISEFKQRARYMEESKRWQYSPAWQLTADGAKALGRMASGTENRKHEIIYRTPETKKDERQTKEPRRSMASST